MTWKPLPAAGARAAWTDHPRSWPGTGRTAAWTIDLPRPAPDLRGHRALGTTPTHFRTRTRTLRSVHHRDSDGLSPSVIPALRGFDRRGVGARSLGAGVGPQVAPGSII